MRRCKYELSRVMGLRRGLTVIIATSLPSKTSIVSMRGTLVVFLVRCEGLEVSAKFFRGLHILSTSRGILIFLAFMTDGFVPLQILGACLRNDNRFRCSISCERVFYKRFQQADMK